MELASLADREGQQCALLRFALTVEFKALPDSSGMLRVNGDGVRSLVTFQDLNWEAKAEWIATGKPPQQQGSSSFHRSIDQPSAPPIVAAEASQSPAARDAEGITFT
jgi:hypothetical protein